MEGDTVKTINLCGRGKCCPKLVVTRKVNGEICFQIADDYDGIIILTEAEGRNLALAILNEVKE